MHEESILEHYFGISCSMHFKGLIIFVKLILSKVWDVILCKKCFIILEEINTTQKLY